jgi:carboxynorspermidine decarboxylase
MNFETIKSAVRTPAYVFDETVLLRNVRQVRQILEPSGCGLLFAVKSCAAWPVLQSLANHVDGFAVSSPFEARLAREVLQDRGSVHVTAPGMRPGEADVLAETCDVVIMNSLSQWERFRDVFSERTSIGLRVNPQRSFVEDERYDPCRAGSKLGVPLDRLAALAETDPSLFDGIEGLHFHNNCDAETFAPLLETVEHIAAGIPALLERVAWVNLGGGYLFEDCEDVPLFHDAVRVLKQGFGLGVMVEPGAAVARSAGFLVASVADTFNNNGTRVAVLDTTVNHLAEIFEYAFQLGVLEESETGQHTYEVAGASCLAGDVLGTYRFDAPLEIGDRITFEDAGAYSMVKEHAFNGIPLPHVFFRACDGTVALVRSFDYAAYAEKCGRGATQCC